MLKSWAVPKGLSLDPSVKRLAIEVGDHSVTYLTFTGELPEGSYGAGAVYRWDTGTFEVTDADPLTAWRSRSFQFYLYGERLKGKWKLFKMRGRKDKGKALWLLQKLKDEFAVAAHTAEIIGKSE